MYNLLRMIYSTVHESVPRKKGLESRVFMFFSFKIWRQGFLYTTAASQQKTAFYILPYFSICFRSCFILNRTRDQLLEIGWLVKIMIRKGFKLCMALLLEFIFWVRIILWPSSFSLSSLCPSSLCPSSLCPSGMVFLNCVLLASVFLTCVFLACVLLLLMSFKHCLSSLCLSGVCLYFLCLSSLCLSSLWVSSLSRYSLCPSILCPSRFSLSVFLASVFLACVFLALFF